MPALTRWFIKTSLVCFVLALLVGVLLALKSVLPSMPAVNLFPVYIHLLVFGWLTQLIFGVVYWMFPKYTPDRPRASASLGWATYVLLNVGLLLRAAGETFMVQQPYAVWGWILVTSAVLQWLAGISFVLNSWGRVKVR